jgi:hypothetical protein
MTQFEGQMPPAQGAPPTYSEPTMVEPQSSWPTVIGVILIVHAVLGSLCACGSFFTVALQQWGAEMAAQSGQNPRAAEIQVGVAESVQLFTYAMGVIGLAMVIWELINGIGLCRRSASSRGSNIAWSIVELLILVLFMAFQAIVIKWQRDQLIAEGFNKEADQAMFGGAFGLCFGLVWSAAVPVFLLIWFSRRKIKDEVASWATSLGRI